MLWVAVGSMVIESSETTISLNLFTALPWPGKAASPTCTTRTCSLRSRKPCSPGFPRLFPSFGRVTTLWCCRRFLCFRFETPFGFGRYGFTGPDRLLGLAVRRFGWDALIFSVMYFPGAEGIIHGQDAVVMLVIGIAGYVLAHRGRNFWAVSSGDWA